MIDLTVIHLTGKPPTPKALREKANAITELFVKPQWREQGVGRQLLAGIFELARRQGWRRVEVTTPPLPEFERIMHFYQCEGFAVTGGRKLRRLM